MEIENKENLNLILQLPFSKEIIIGNLEYDILKIDLQKRISNLYMKSIGFTPKITKDGYCYFDAELGYNNKVAVYEMINNGSSSYGGNNRVDITDSEILNIDNLLNGFTFILLDYKDKVVNIKKYVIKKYDDKFSIENDESLLLKFHKKNLTIYKNGAEVLLDAIESFFDDIDYGLSGMFEKMKRIIFDSLVNEKGFIDIYKKYNRFINKSPNNNMWLSAYDIFRYYYYIGQSDFYFLSEYFIKNDIEDKLISHNPIFTGRPIEKLSDIPTLSKVGMEIYKRYGFSDDEDILFRMESDDNVGKDGVKIIYDYIKQIENISSYNVSMLRTGRISYLFEKIYKILNTFEITPKNLMNRFVKAMFYENLSIDKYANIITDYIEMCQLLTIKIDKKLPKDIVRLHDLLQDQITYIKNKKIEDMFKESIKANNELLKLLPESNDFTIISPSNPNDLIQEGLVLNHCVGSYIDRYASGYSKIFFVRRKLFVEQPFATLELNRNNQVVQFSEHSNKTPNTNANKFVERWIDDINK